MTAKTILRLRRSSFFDGRIHLDAAQTFSDGRLALAGPVTWTIHDSECALPDNSLLTLDADAAQALIDELWHLGIRPTEGHGSTGQLAATERHLNDTRHLLDKTLTTVLNVVNAGLVTQHSLPIPGARHSDAAPPAAS